MMSQKQTEEKGLERALFCARQFGAEACANQKGIYPDSDSRFDIAFYYGVEKWAEIPVDHRNLLVAKYAEGWNVEKALRA
jgi:hypothetical protein